MSGTVEAGNKIIVNTGLVEMHGKSRNRMTRLASPITKGQKGCQIEPNLDWVQGDKVYFAPTNHWW